MTEIELRPSERVTVRQRDAETLVVEVMIDIPRGCTHRVLKRPGPPDPRDLGDASSRAHRGIVVSARRRGRQHQAPGVLTLAPLLHEYRDVFCVAGPQPLRRPALAALAILGRRIASGRAAPVAAEAHRTRVFAAAPCDPTLNVPGPGERKRTGRFVMRRHRTRATLHPMTSSRIFGCDEHGLVDDVRRGPAGLRAYLSPNRGGLPSRGR
jgi:hypothetical protein